MRSEERAGIVLSALLLLWGTLITEPFRICTDFFYKCAVRTMSSSPDDLISVPKAFAAVVFFALFTIGLLVLSKLKACVYIPCGLFGLVLAVYLVKALFDLHADVGTIVSLIIAVTVLGFLYFFKAERILIWTCDICIYSFPVFLIAGLATRPLGRLSGILDKILYINNGQKYDLSASFEGFLTLPGIAWGVFLIILVSLPIIYYSFSRKRG